MRDRINWAVYWVGVCFICVCIALALQGCGDPLPPICEEEPVDSVEAGIVGGEPSTDRRSMALVVRESGGYCSATVVGEHTVLTANHCDRMVHIYVDAFHARVVDELVHPNANPVGAHDLRLLYTDVPLPGPYAELGHPEYCSSFIVQGFGQDHPGELRERVVRELKREDGVVYFTPGTCNGDSGGPVWAMTDRGPIQVAVTSFGFDCFNGSPGGFVDLTQDDNIAWILENIR